MRVLAAVLSAARLLASDPWSASDTKREALFLGLTLIDWRQTLDISNHPGMHEQNPLLGMHPSRQRINNHFLFVAVVHPLIARALPQPYRKVFQYVYIAIEAGTVGHNSSIGLRITF